MNYTHLKIGFIMAIAIIGIMVTNTAYKTMTNIMNTQNAKLEAVLNF